jgi:signal transduction histidine kinase
LEACHCPETESQDEEFVSVLEKVIENLQINGSLSTLMHKVQELTGESSIPAGVNRGLMDYLTLRAGLRFLMQHYMESSKGSKYGFAGIFELRCSPAAVARKAARECSRVCEHSLGKAPEIIVTGDVCETIAFVPTVLHYVLTEFFKNSCRAVVERHTESGYYDLPPVTCDIKGTEDGLVIKVSDKGCGMSKEQLERMWDFMHTTCKQSPWADGSLKGRASLKGSLKGSMKGSISGKFSPGVLAGYGMGISLSQMYAQYFGGALLASSEEGVGTEVTMHLSRSRFCREVLPSSCCDNLSLIDYSSIFHAP